MTGRLVAFLSGLVFAVGLGISGMTQPTKVIGFLDFFGAWDPSLAFVMLGAIGVYATAWRMVRARPRSIAGGPLELPDASAIDGRLLGGAALFGLGWGLSGFCPGPAIVALVSGAPGVLVFVIAMGTGMVIFRALDARQQEPLGS